MELYKVTGERLEAYQWEIGDLLIFLEHTKETDAKGAGMIVFHVERREKGFVLRSEVMPFSFTYSYSFMNELKPSDVLVKQLLSNDFPRHFLFRQFHHLTISPDISLSIQASCNHYCSPKATLIDLSHYDSMEVAILYRDTFVSSSDVFIGHKRLVNQLNNHFEGQIYADVPVPLIQELYEALMEEYN